MIDCFDNVVGYSTKDCECSEDSRPTDYNTSLSGYYLDEGEHGVPINLPQSNLECGDDNVWDLLDTTRKQAINDFLTGIGLNSSYHVNSRVDGKSIITGNGNDNKYVDGTNKGIVIAPVLYKGVTYVIDRVRVKLNGTQETTFTITDESDNIVKSVTVAYVKNGYVDIGLSARLPMSDKGNPKTYFLNNDSDLDNANNTLSCTTCGGGNPIDKFINIRGYSGTIASYDTSNSANGYIIDARLECSLMNGFCAADDGYWANTPTGRLTAKTIQLLWASKTISEILKSNQPSFYTTVGREELLGNRRKYNKLATDMMIDIVDRLTPALSHCYSCNNKYGMENVHAEI